MNQNNGKKNAQAPKQNKQRVFGVVFAVDEVWKNRDCFAMLMFRCIV